jgi:hypothetical protein
MRDPEPFPFRCNRNGGFSSLFDAFSSREPASTSLENALAYRAAKCLQIDETPLRGICTAAAPLMPALQGHLRTWVLVMAVAFPHHAVQEKSIQRPAEWPSDVSAD